jgi:hypothetical protein
VSQVNVNPSRGDGDGSDAAAAAGMGTGMILMLIVGLIILLLLAYFVLRPLFFGGPANVNVNVRSSDVFDVARYVLA